MITVIGIAVAAISNGQRSANSQAGIDLIATINVTGKAIAAVIEASDTYRHIRTTTAHIITAAKAHAV